VTGRRATAARGHPAYWAFVVHRLSGIALAAFLPLHFWALGLAIEGAASLDTFVTWADTPLVHLAETGLVVLLAGHLAGGARLLLVEFSPWRDGRKDLIALGAGLSLVFGLAFALNLT